MVESIYACPSGTTLEVLPALDCLVSVGNIQAVALQIKQATPSFTSSSLLLLATWTPLLASATATGIRAIPATNFETTPGEAITEGGNDASTYLGREKVKGMGFTKASYTMEGVSAAFAKAVKEFTKKSVLAGQRSKLRAFFLTDENYIICGPDYNGVEVWAHVVQDVKKGGGFKQEDMYGVSFGMDYGWSLNAISAKASFEVLDLVQFAS